MTFQGGVSITSNKRPFVTYGSVTIFDSWQFLTHGSVTMLSESQLMAASQCFRKAKVVNFPTSLSFYSCVTMGRESSVHSAWGVLYCACF